MSSARRPGRAPRHSSVERREKRTLLYCPPQTNSCNWRDTGGWGRWYASKLRCRGGSLYLPYHMSGQRWRFEGSPRAKHFPRILFAAKVTAGFSFFNITVKQRKVFRSRGESNPYASTGSSADTRSIIALWPVLQSHLSFLFLLLTVCHRASSFI